MVQRLHEETAQYPIPSVIQPKMTLERLTALLRAQMARQNIWWNYEKQVRICMVGKKFSVLCLHFGTENFDKKYDDEFC